MPVYRENLQFLDKTIVFKIAMNLIQAWFSIGIIRYYASESKFAYSRN